MAAAELDAGSLQRTHPLAGEAVPPPVGVALPAHSGVGEDMELPSRLFHMASPVVLNRNDSRRAPLFVDRPRSLCF